MNFLRGVHPGWFYLDLDPDHREKPGPDPTLEKKSDPDTTFEKIRIWIRPPKKNWILILRNFCLIESPFTFSFESN